MNPENQVPEETKSLHQEGAQTDLTRRKAIKLGVYAAYTAPVLLALLTPSKNARAGFDLGPPGSPP